MSFAQTFIDFGFNLSGTKEAAVAKNGEELGLIAGGITQARLLLSLAAGLMCLFIGSFIPILRANIIYAVLAFIAVCGRSLAPDFIFQGKEEMAPLTIRYLVSKTTSTVLTLLIVDSSSDLCWIPVLDIFASLIALAWSFAAANRLFGVRLSWMDLPGVLKGLTCSGYYCLSNMASTAFSGIITLLIGIAITDMAQISYWSLAMTAVNAVQALYSPIINSLYPHMVAGGDFGFAKKLIVISVPFVVAGTVLFIFLSRVIVFILGGPEYLEGAYILRLVSPVLVFSFYGMMLGWPVLGAMGRVKELTRTTVVSSLANQERGQTPFTPAVGILLQIHERLKQIIADGGYDIEVSRCHKIAQDFRRRLMETDLPLEMRLESPSNAVTYISVRGFSAKSLIDEMKNHYGIWLCPNGGPAADVSFRVGHLGAHTLADNALLVSALLDARRRGYLG